MRKGVGAATTMFWAWQPWAYVGYYSLPFFAVDPPWMGIWHKWHSKFFGDDPSADKFDALFVNNRIFPSCC